MTAPLRVYLLDNRDSFTWNLVQAFEAAGAAVTVERSDTASVDDVVRGGWQRVVISPGPGTPERAGITMALIARLAGRVPLLGVCLGHQAIGAHYGGRIVRAPALMHGKTSLVHHDGGGLFHGLESPFPAMRYHSLVVDPVSVPGVLEVTARTADGVVMGLRHRTLPVEGVQFHPESILTPAGARLLENFLAAPARRAA